VEKAASSNAEMSNAEKDVTEETVYTGVVGAADPVGACDGDTLGARDAVCEGDTLGETEGEAAGACEGEAVVGESVAGEAVGDTLGVCEGDTLSA
jgi:hypothetical protein